jgi:outer membrane cobalamin receptor
MTGTRRFGLLGIVVLLAHGALARAEDVQPKDADLEEPIMVVTASRVEEAASEAVVTTDVITR